MSRREKVVFFVQFILKILKSYYDLMLIKSYYHKLTTYEVKSFFKLNHQIVFNYHRYLRMCMVLLSAVMKLSSERW